MTPAAEVCQLVQIPGSHRPTHTQKKNKNNTPLVQPIVANMFLHNPLKTRHYAQTTFTDSNYARLSIHGAGNGMPAVTHSPLLVRGKNHGLYMPLGTAGMAVERCPGQLRHIIQRAQQDTQPASGAEISVI